MTSENYGVRESSDVPNELTIDHDLSLHDLGIDINGRNSKFFCTFDHSVIQARRDPIGSDIIHVSGGDAERDFEDDHLALPKLSWSTSTQGI